MNPTNAQNTPDPTMSDELVEVLSYYEDLPDDIGSLLSDSLLDALIYEITDAYRLPNDSAYEVLRATESLLSGEVQPKDFVRTLQEVSKTDEQTALNIAHDINARVFSLVKDSLERVYKNASVTAPSVRTESAPPSSGVPSPAVAPASPFGTLKERVGAATAAPASEPSSLEKKLGSSFSVAAPEGTRGGIYSGTVVQPVPPQQKSADPYRESV
jgi:hypothetical protein